MMTTIMRCNGTRLARSMIGVVGPRFFSMATIPKAATEPAIDILMGATDFIQKTPTRVGPRNDLLLLRFRVMGIHSESTMSLRGEKEQEKQVQAGSAAGVGPAEEKAVPSYWGVAPTKVTKEDGSPWKWHCFMVCY